MSTDHALLPEVDPFPYGWRDIYHDLPDGGRRHEQVPLTIEDILHPQEGDCPCDGNTHSIIRHYLARVFRRMLAHDPGALVLSNCGICWPPPHGKHHAPDVCVLLGVKSKRVDRLYFDVAAEGVCPCLIVEVVAPQTRMVDVVIKLQHYYDRQVPHYVIVDRARWEDSPTIVGYRHTPAGYVLMPNDEHGRLWLEPVGVWLAPKGYEVVCTRKVAGEELLDYAEMAEQLEAAKARAQAEKARADAATARLLAMEAELQRLRQQPPAQSE